MAFMTLMLAAMVGSVHGATAQQAPTECADGSMTLWMKNSDGKNPCQLVQDVLRVCEPSFSLGFLPRGYTCDNSPGSALSPCCCGSPTFALMSACWSCQYNITFDLVSTTFTSFVRGCQTLPNPMTTYDTSVRSSIAALDLPRWSETDPLAGKWDLEGAWRNATSNSTSPTSAPPIPTGYPVQYSNTGISKGALAGAIVGAILGSKLLFMAAGYLFYRWWKNQPSHRNDDDHERSYVHHVFGEPKYPRRAVTRQSRKGSRAHVDLDEDTSPRSSRWLGVPSYLQPTSFHSPSSGSESGQPELNPQYSPVGPYARGEGAVTPFISSQPPVESEKARARRQSTSLHLANAGVTSDEDNNAPAPQPTLLAHAQSVSPGPTSPAAVMNSPPILSATSRSNSHENAIPASNLHARSSTDSRSRSRSHSHSNSNSNSNSGSGGRYQEDDAGVSIVIENGNDSREAVRSVPPAYVDYRKGYSNAHLDKSDLFRHGSAQADGSNNTHGESSRSGGSEAGGPGASDTSATCIDSPSGSTRPPSLKKSDIEIEMHDTDTVDAKTMTETNTVREPEADQRDRTESGDSAGAATIRPAESEHPGPVERSSTTDLAALTAANTAANRPSSPGSNISYQPARPAHPSHTSAPPGVTFSDHVSRDHVGSEHDIRQTPGSDSPPSSDASHAVESSTPWSWGRALGAFGLGGTNAPK